MAQPSRTLSLIERRSRFSRSNLLRALYSCASSDPGQEAAIQAGLFGTRTDDSNPTGSGLDAVYGTAHSGRHGSCPRLATTWARYAIESLANWGWKMPTEHDLSSRPTHRIGVWFDGLAKS